MIEAVVAKWVQLVHGEVDDAGAFLDELLADDVVFYSPVVFSAQEGKAITKLYLSAAGSVFGGEKPAGAAAGNGSKKSGGFVYLKKVLSGKQAMLEFETEMGGKYVNGVDMIQCNDEGKIVEFKVMIRPLQAVNMVHAKMGEMLKAMQEGSTEGQGHGDTA